LQVNFQAVKQRFVDTGRKPTSWARSKGMGSDLFRRWLNQRYIPVSGGVAEKRYIALLAEDDLLVLVDEPEPVEPRPCGTCGRALKDAGCAGRESGSGGRGEGEKVTCKDGQV